MKRFAIRFFGILFLCLVFAGCVQNRPAGPFSQYPENLVDPALVYGVLPNGFQYILLENQTPKDRVSMHLNVFAGSIHETDEQQGLAHYLEHMLFNGSTHFKPGELIAFFQSIGMGFGADANASTSYFRTRYDLNLPKGDRKHLQDGLLVFQDYAYGAMLSEEEVNRERGIILAEKRERDSVSYQMFQKKMAFELPGSLLNLRHPIGLKEVIETADSKLLRQFYERWYRPDNMLLVAVGDFDAKDLESMILKSFSEFPLSEDSDRKTKEMTPDIAWVPHKPGIHSFYLHDPEAQTTTIAIEHIEYRPFVYQSLEDLKETLIQEMGNQILSRRLIHQIRNQKSGFSSGGAFSGQFLQNLSLAGIQGRFSDPDQWESGVQELENLLRQAMEYGFTREELVRAKADVTTAVKVAAKQSQTRETPALARQILAAVDKRELILSPAQREEILVPFIQDVSLEQVHQVFKKTWAQDHRLVLVTGNVQIPVTENTTELAHIQKAYQLASQKPVLPLPDSQARKFPYLPIPVSSDTSAFQQGEPGESGRIIRQEENIHNTGVSIFDFENHTRLAVKQNDFQKEQVMFSLVFGTGLSGQPASKPGLAVLAASTVDQSGFGSMTADELEQALAGRNVSMNFSADEGFFSLDGTADADELELVFQLVYTFLKDPGFSSQALALAKIWYTDNYNTRKRTTDGIYRIKGPRFLAGDDARFGLPHPDIVQKYTLEDVKNYLADSIENAPVELSIVGDVDSAAVLRYARTYLGGLDKRKPVKITNENPRLDFPLGKKLTLSLDTRIEKEMVRLCFLTDDFWDIRKTRRLSVLARVFSERLRKIVREDLGAVYSPYAYNDPSRAWKGYGVFQVVATVAPEEIQPISEALGKIAGDLYTNGVDPREVEPVLKPVLEQLKVVYKTNEFWLNSVMKDSFRFPRKLEWPTHIMEDYGQIRAEDLTDLARQYLDPARAAKIIITRKRF